MVTCLAASAWWQLGQQLGRRALAPFGLCPDEPDIHIGLLRGPPQLQTSARRPRRVAELKLPSTIYSATKRVLGPDGGEDGAESGLGFPAMIGKNIADHFGEAFFGNFCRMQTNPPLLAGNCRGKAKHGANKNEMDHPQELSRSPESHKLLTSRFQSEQSGTWLYKRNCHEEEGKRGHRSSLG